MKISGKPTILCVDDEKTTLDSLKRQLGNFLGRAYAIETVQSGREAIQVVEQLVNDSGEPPYLVISDQQMPDMLGSELLQRLYKSYPNTYYIMLTGHANKEDTVSAINNCRLYRYKSKPWEVTDLNVTVKQALDSYRKSREMETFNYRVIQQFNGAMATLNETCQQAKISERKGNEVRWIEKVEEITSDMEILSAELMRAYEVNSLSLSFEKINLKEVVGDVRNTLWPIMDSPPFEFVTNIGSNVEFTSSRKLVKIILKNIAENAVHCFSTDQKSCKLTIHGHMEFNQIRISIEDNGIGIEVRDRAKIFEMCFGDQDMNRGYHELGLYIAKKAVERLDGSISVSNTLPGLTAVEVTLPVGNAKDHSDRYQTLAGL